MLAIAIFISARPAAVHGHRHKRRRQHKAQPLGLCDPLPTQSLGLTQRTLLYLQPPAGGPGPRVESWAFAVDDVGLDALVQRSVLRQRRCKLCEGADGIVVQGEYGITLAMFQAGFNVASLMSKYKRVSPAKGCGRVPAALRGPL